MRDTRDVLPKAESARILRVSNMSLRKLITLGVIATDNAGKPLASAVRALAAQSDQRTYMLGREHARPGRPPMFACPITDENLGATLFLSDHDDVDRDDHTRAQHALAARGLAHLHAEGVTRFTGYWRIGQDDVDELVEQHGVLLGVVCNHVIEAARVIAQADTIDHQMRKVLLVEPITGPAFDEVAGYAPGANQNPLVATIQ